MANSEMNLPLKLPIRLDAAVWNVGLTPNPREKPHFPARTIRKQDFQDIDVQITGFNMRKLRVDDEETRSRTRLCWPTGRALDGKRRAEIETFGGMGFC
jgi:hypothetical protein